MEFIPQNPILEFKENTLTLLRKQYNFVNATDMNRAIDVLDAWIKKQDHFVRKEFPRSYLEKVIMANKGSIEQTKIKLDKLCTYRTLMPHFFGENLTKNNFEDLLEDFISSLLPKPTDDKYRVFVMKNKGKTFTSQQFLNLYRYAVLIVEYYYAYDYSNGLVIFIDLTEANLVEHIKNMNIVELRQAIAIITEGFGMRLHGIHLLTSSKTIEALVNIVKQFLPAKIGSRISVHKDMITVYKYIPKDILPSEYGGKENSIYTLRNELMNVLTSEDFRKYIEEMNEAKTNESFRQTDKFNDQYMGTPGSFRLLTTD